MLFVERTVPIEEGAEEAESCSKRLILDEETGGLSLMSNRFEELLLPSMKGLETMGTKAIVQSGAESVE